MTLLVTTKKGNSLLSIDMKKYKYFPMFDEKGTRTWRVVFVDKKGGYTYYTDKEIDRCLARPKGRKYTVENNSTINHLFANEMRHRYYFVSEELHNIIKKSKNNHDNTRNQK